MQFPVLSWPTLVLGPSFNVSTATEQSYGGGTFPLAGMSIHVNAAESYIYMYLSSCSSKRQLEKDLEAVREAGRVSSFRIDCSVPYYLPFVS